MENPYWHAEFKPHLVNREEIRQLCFEIYAIVSSSMSFQGTGIENTEEESTPEFLNIEKLFFNRAEPELAKRLLRLALLVRTFDDAMERSAQADNYRQHFDNVKKSNPNFGATFEGPDTTTESLRECSNKIIHAEDLRPTYETEDDSRDPNAKWGMTGDIEIKGTRGKNNWAISITLSLYLEGILDLIAFDENDPIR